MVDMALSVSFFVVSVNILRTYRRHLAD